MPSSDHRDKLPREADAPIARQAADLGRYAGLGMQFALTMALGGALGYWLDTQFNTSPWLLVAGVLLGSTFAFIALVKAVPKARNVKPLHPPSDDSAPPTE